MNRDKELEQLKAKTFLNKNAAFLGCLLCRLKFSWDESAETASVDDNMEFKWNPAWFDMLSEPQRQGVLLHELWHIALLHGLRMESRDPLKWNIACDIRINNNLIKDHYILPEGALYDMSKLDSKYSEEDIYNSLPSKHNPPEWGTRLVKTSGKSAVAWEAMVQQTLIAAKLAGVDVGNIEKLIVSILKPKLPWKTLLHHYLTEKLEASWTWKRPNRRYSNIYLPAFKDEDEGLASIVVALDTSASISDDEIKRVAAEVKYIQEHMNPQKLIVIQFDYKIQKITEYHASKPFNFLKFKEGGGTSYKELREYIVKHSPTLTIIFTDLYADPMVKVKQDVLWVVFSHKTPNFGKTIHVHE